MLLNYLYHYTLVGNIVSEANNPASKASLAKFGAKRQFFASKYLESYCLCVRNQVANVAIISGVKSDFDAVKTNST